MKFPRMMRLSPFGLPRHALWAGDSQGRYAVVDVMEAVLDLGPAVDDPRPTGGTYHRVLSPRGVLGCIYSRCLRVLDSKGDV